MPLQKVTLRVPATTANLGPAFDCMGLALGLYATVTLERSDSLAVEVTGHGARRLPRDAANLVYRAIAALYERLGAAPPPLRLRCHNAIPLRRGLGSSAAGVVAGLVAANALEERQLPASELLRLAAALEGHPDNVAPALLGGCQIVVSCAEGPRATPVPVRRGLRAVLFIPHAEVPTRRARQLLPRRVPREDAVYNIGRAALLTLALTAGRWDLLPLATQDRLHQDARRALMPAMAALFDAARGAGAAGVFLSGAGPTVLALTPGDPGPIGRAMAQAADAHGLPGRWRSVAVGVRGAHVLDAS